MECSKESIDSEVTDDDTASSGNNLANPAPENVYLKDEQPENGSTTEKEAHGSGCHELSTTDGREPEENENCDATKKLEESSLVAVSTDLNKPIDKTHIYVMEEEKVLVDPVKSDAHNLHMDGASGVQDASDANHLAKTNVNTSENREQKNDLASLSNEPDLVKVPNVNDLQGMPGMDTAVREDNSEGTENESELYQPSNSHILVEGPNVEALLKPIKASTRIKYTCITVGQRYIGIGTSTGAIYLFEKHSLLHIQMVAGDTKEGGVAELAFSSDESVLAYGTNKGFVIVMELHLEKRTKPDRVRITNNHKGSVITAMHWSQDGRQVFVGDERGLVTTVNANTKARDMLKLPSEVIMRLDSPVVQIDSVGDKVLVSSTKASFLAITSVHKFLTIGTKARDGRYGGCFYHARGPNSVPVMYCARPGSRLWEVSQDGDVLNTHLFKVLLDVPPVQIMSDGNRDFELQNVESLGPQSAAFHHLYPLGDHYLMAVSDKGLYVLDPAEVKVMLWTNRIKDVQSLTCKKNDIYILFKDNTVQTISLMPVTKYLVKLHSWKSRELLHSLYIKHRLWVLKTSSKCSEMLSIAIDLEDQLSKTDQKQDQILTTIKSKLEQKLQSMQESVELRKARSDSNASSGAEPPAGFSRLDSGMYVMKVRSESIGSDDLEHDAILERVLAKEKTKTSAEDTKSVDTMSISSNTSDPGKVETKILEAKSKLMGLKNKLKGKISRIKSESVIDTTTDKSQFDEDKSSGLKRELSEPMMTHNDSPSSENLYPVHEVQINEKQSLIEDMERTTSKIDSAVKENGVIPIEKSEAVDSSYESDVASERRSATFDGVSQSEHQDLDHTQEKILPRSRSSESLLSSEVKETAEDCGKDSGGSRRGSFTSNDISVSSSELVFGPPVIDPEPVYAKTKGVVGQKGKKKRSSVVDIDLDAGPGVGTSQAQKRKMKRSKSQKEVKAAVNTASTVVDSSPRLRRSHTVSTDLPSEENNVSPHVPSTIPVVRRSLPPTKGTPDSSGSSPSPLTSSLEGEGENLAGKEEREVSSSLEPSPNLGSKLMSVKDKVGPKAWSIMQTIKEGVGKLGGGGGRKEVTEVNPDTIGRRSKDTLIWRNKQGQISEADSTPSEPEVAHDIEAEPVIVPRDPSSLVDLKPLQHATVHAKNQLENPDTLLDLQASRAVLSEWVVHLNQAVNHLHVAMATAELKAEAKKIRAKAVEETEARQAAKILKEANEVGEKSTENIPQSEINDDVPDDLCYEITDEKVEIIRGIGGPGEEAEEISDIRNGVTTGKNSIQSSQENEDLDGVLQNTEQNLENKVASDEEANSVVPLQISAHNNLKEEAKDLKKDDKSNRDGTEINHDEYAPDISGDPHEEVCNGTDDVISNERHSEEEDLDDNEKENSEDLKTASVITPSISSELKEKFLKPLYLTDPFDMGAGLHEDVSQLATLCFTFKVHGNISHYLVPKLESSESLMSGFITCNETTGETHEEKGPSEGDSKANEIKPLSDKDPETEFGEAGSDLGCEFKELAVFMKCHYHCLDHDNLHQTVQRYDRGRENMWQTLVHCSTVAGEHYDSDVHSFLEQKQTLKALTSLVNNQHQDRTRCILGHIYRAYHLDPEETLKFVGNEKPAGVSPSDVLCLIKAGSENQQEIMARLQLYADHYLQGTDGSDERTEVEALCEDEEVKRILLEALLQDRTDRRDVSCTCGFPRPQGHCAQWRRGELIRRILALPAASDEDQQTMEAMTYSHGYWLGHLHLLQKSSNSYCRLVPTLVLQLCDINLLSDGTDFGYMPSSNDEWQKLLNLRELQEYGFDNAPTSDSLNESVAGSGLQNSNISPDQKKNELTEKTSSVHLYCLKCGTDFLRGNRSNAAADQAKEQHSSDLDLEPMTLSNDENNEPSSPCVDAQTVLDEMKTKLAGHTITKSSDTEEGKNHVENDPPKAIQWERLACVLVSNIGVRSALEMLENVRMPPDVLSTVFFDRCLQTEVIQQQQSLLLHNLLERLDTYLWSKRPSALPPQLLLAAELEHQSGGMKKSFDPAVEAVLSSVLLSGSSLVEESGGHWGISSSINQACVTCGCPLQDDMSITQPGVIFYRCGHGFHRSCSKQDECEVCHSTSS